jgi:hypothetical protein
MQPHEDWRGRNSLPGIFPALIVIGIGVLFLLNNLNIFFIHDVWRYWPVLLIAAGLAKMVDSPFSGGRVTGGILMGAGGLFLAGNLGFLNLTWEDFWPLVLIGAGVLMLWNRLALPAVGTAEIPAATHEGVLHEHAVFGGVERRVTTDDFRGGHVLAIFGGVDIKIPQNWIAVSHVAAIFGGFGNKSVQPNAGMPGVKHLYIRGAALFGGVAVKN